MKITKKTPYYIFSVIEKYYKNCNEMYIRFNKELVTRPNIRISKIRYKNSILLLLSYNKNIILF